MNERNDSLFYGTGGDLQIRPIDTVSEKKTVDDVFGIPVVDDAPLCVYRLSFMNEQMIIHRFAKRLMGCIYLNANSF
jgi:hypothetical protein